MSELSQLHSEVKALTAAVAQLAAAFKQLDGVGGDAGYGNTRTGYVQDHAAYNQANTVHHGTSLAVAALAYGNRATTGTEGNRGSYKPPVNTFALNKNPYLWRSSDPSRPALPGPSQPALPNFRGVAIGPSITTQGQLPAGGAVDTDTMKSQLDFAKFVHKYKINMSDVGEMLDRLNLNMRSDLKPYGSFQDSSTNALPYNAPAKERIRGAGRVARRAWYSAQHMARSMLRGGRDIGRFMGEMYGNKFERRMLGGLTIGYGIKTLADYYKNTPITPEQRFTETNEDFASRMQEFEQSEQQRFQGEVMGGVRMMTHFAAAPFYQRALSGQLSRINPSIPAVRARAGALRNGLSRARAGITNVGKGLLSRAGPVAAIYATIEVGSNLLDRSFGTYFQELQAIQEQADKASAAFDEEFGGKSRFKAQRELRRLADKQANLFGSESVFREMLSLTGIMNSEKELKRKAINDMLQNIKASAEAAEKGHKALENNDVNQAVMEFQEARQQLGDMNEQRWMKPRQMYSEVQQAKTARRLFAHSFATRARERIGD